MVLASTSVEETADFGFVQKGFGDVTGRRGCLPGGKKDWSVCAVCCHVICLAACISGDRGYCTTCEALSPHVVVDRVPCYTRCPAGIITKGSIVF